LGKGARGNKTKSLFGNETSLKKIIFSYTGIRGGGAGEGKKTGTSRAQKEEKKIRVERKNKLTTGQ